MKVVPFALVVVAGCTSVPAVAPSMMRAESSPTVADSVAKARDDADSVIASLAPAPAPRGGRWAGAGSDEPAEVRVTAPREGESPLREERRVGSNEQPEWTTERRFATVRSYVIAPGQIEVEQWLKMHAPLGEGPDHFWQTEIAMGFEGGWQLDLYENYGNDAGEATKHLGVQLEARYALGKWGEIPLNPTLYAEYVHNSEAPDKVELKALFADEIAPAWHWAANLFWEQENGGLRGTELGASAGISWSVADSKFAVGAEAKYERATENGTRSIPNNEFLLGPSFQWRPMENMHVDLVPLCGLTGSDRKDPRFEVYLVIGYDFGPERKEATAPTSSRSR